MSNMSSLWCIWWNSEAERFQIEISVPYWISLRWIKLLFFLSTHQSGCRLSLPHFCGRVICLVKTEKRSRTFCVCTTLCSSVLNFCKQVFVVVHFDFLFVDSLNISLISESISVCSPEKTRANWALNLNMWHQNTEWQQTGPGPPTDSEASLTVDWIRHCLKPSPLSFY